MKKKPQTIPLYSIFAHDMDRLRLELSLPTMDPKLAKAIEDARDRCASEYARLQAKRSIVNRKNASAPKKPNITKAVLEEFRKDFEFNTGAAHGWKTAACSKFHITMNTLNARLKNY